MPVNITRILKYVKKKSSPMEIFKDISSLMKARSFFNLPN